MAEPCPRCSFPDVPGDKCPQCGVLVALYRASLDKLRRGPGGPVHAPPAAVFQPPASPSAPPPPVPVAGPPSTLRLSFHGSALGLFGIQAVNALLTLLTAGVFYFWAKTRVRRYLLGESELEGDRFAYHGSGRELLVGFVKGMAWQIASLSSVFVSYFVSLKFSSLLAPYMGKQQPLNRIAVLALERLGPRRGAGHGLVQLDGDSVVVCPAGDVQ